MKKVTLGQTGLQINPIGFGANAIGGHNLYPNIDEAENRKVLNEVFDQGINFIDTAFIYGEGRSEEIIGEVIQERGNRNDLVIASKAANDGDSFNNHPQFLKEQVDIALKRLRTDYIDLFYIHFPDKETPKDQAVQALKELKDQGKIRAIGVSNFSLDQIKEANKDGLVEVVQDHYNLLHRDAETELFPYLRENNISFIPFFPFQSGLLTGKYKGDETFPEGDLRGGQEDFKGQQFKDNVERVEKLRPIAEEKGVSIANIVLAFYLQVDVIDAVIPGAKRIDQVNANLQTLEVSLSPEEVDFIDQTFAGK